jgi:hypothetical protein
MTSSNVPASENVEHLLQQLEEKVKEELSSQHHYESLQYIQSFIARKKKFLGQKGVSTAVFLGANLITSSYKPASSNDATSSANSLTPPPGLSSVSTSTSANTEASNTAKNCGITTGSLLKWFIEDGAGVDYQFKFHSEGINEKNYCDIENLYNFLNSIDIIIAGYIIDAIYNPLHVLITKTKIKKNSPLSKRITKLEILFANLFFANKRWLNSFKCYNRLNNTEKMTESLLQWSNDGYSCEKPLFFSRGVLQLLSEGKISLANDLLHSSMQHIDDNIGVGKKGGGSMSSSLTIWHVTTILTDLANLPPAPRIDKTKLFNLLFNRYAAFFGSIDTKLFDLFSKIGEVCFHFVLENKSSPNPMAMLQGLLGGMGGGGMPGVPGGGNRGAGGGRGNANNSNGANPLGGMDFGSLMQMMKSMGQL